MGQEEMQEALPVSYPGLEGSAQLSLGVPGDPQDSLSRPRMKPFGQGPLPARPPATVWDARAVAPNSLAAGQPRTDWPRRLKTAFKGFWVSRPSFSTIYFLFGIFVVSVIFHCHQRLALVPSPWAYSAHVVLVPTHLGREGLFTINSKGRLGNQMGQYATLYALAKANGRPAFIPRQMHSALAPIFRISLPVLHSATASRIPWQTYHLNDWMEEEYRHIPGKYVRLMGYPCSWTFYHHLRPEILQEFTLHDHVREEAQAFLRALQAKWAWQVTFVGVHVRRGDYVRVMPKVWKGVLADRGYLRQAMDWFRARYHTPVFVVTSDDMAWCRESISGSLGDVMFAGNGLQGSPAKDFALLTQCNHSIITVGTFGIWAAYLAGGNTVYLANFTLPDSPFHMVFRPQAAFLPEWVGIAADLGQASQNRP
ncbi:galactoside 2-alpha-L-fucosyltransferase SEC1-like [Microcebus murinus]|uniref:galactoside 2-alpha-L-fucosyltransferase SEC1-like n=1 Tax=Microcebus murinus TaxID=30608 RepID=UPI003F6B242C